MLIDLENLKVQSSEEGDFKKEQEKVLSPSSYVMKHTRETQTYLSAGNFPPYNKLVHQHSVHTGKFQIIFEFFLIFRHVYIRMHIES